MEEAERVPLSGKVNYRLEVNYSRLWFDIFFIDFFFTAVCQIRRFFF